MPFELGIDFACRLYRRGMGDKRILILEEESYRYQAALSDIAGFDIQSHNGDYQAAVRKVRNWLVNEGALVQDGATRILNAYTDFQAWYYRSRLDAGFSEEDIQDYPTRELLDAMKLWLEQGKPLT
jgi:glucuronate isomerase